MKLDLERAYDDLGVDLGAAEQFGQSTAQYLKWLEVEMKLEEDGQEMQMDGSRS